MLNIGFFPTCSFWPLCLQLGEGVVYIPGWRRTQGLLVGRTTTGIESCPAQQICLFLCNLLRFPSTLYAKVLLWDKVNCETFIFPQWWLLYNLLFQLLLINALRSGAVDYRISSLWTNHFYAHTRLYLCVHVFDKLEPSFSSSRHADFKVGYCPRRACMCHLEVWGWRALLSPKQIDLKKDNLSRFSWEKVICCLLSADSEEWDVQISRNLSLMTHFN